MQIGIQAKTYIKTYIYIIYIYIYIYIYQKYIQIYKCVLTEEQKILLCQFKINISTCSSASTNWIIVRQRRIKSQEILYSKSNKNFCACIYIYTYIHTYIYIYIYTYIYIYINLYIQTYIHTLRYIHRHIHIHITNAYIHTYISIHRCPHTHISHDYVHVHAIVKMQLKIFMMDAHTCTQACMSKWTHICTHICVCSPSISHMHALSSHVTVKYLSSSYN